MWHVNETLVSFIISDRLLEINTISLITNHKIIILIKNVHIYTYRHRRDIDRMYIET